MIPEAQQAAPCLACGARRHRVVLDKGPINIWTDMADDEGLRRPYRCLLHQCEVCGHVYQPVDPELKDVFGEIYRSRHAQGPSAMGIGTWGMQRADRLFFGAVDLAPHRTALEIGCGDGYLLKQLKARGFERLTGIEPSPNVETQPTDGITFINDFIHPGLRLQEKVDLAYSVAVFEHIEDLHGVLEFCRNNLTDDGELFFAVPNAEESLKTGDPDLFVHQHVHYFTESSIRNALAASGFEVCRIVVARDAFQVTARPASGPTSTPREAVSYADYQARLDARLDRLRPLLLSERVVVHGACNALNNITGWIGAGRFVLADNDRHKQGKRYFGRIVRALDDLDLTAFDTAVVVPAAYHDPIEADYRARGFRGDIVGIG